MYVVYIILSSNLYYSIYIISDSDLRSEYARRTKKFVVRGTSVVVLSFVSDEYSLLSSSPRTSIVDRVIIL
jgi:hypothetical protein